jgi:Tfp pilus assembly protein PilN
MSVVFSVNFRRQAYEREMARSRARVIGLGVWLAYFGAIVVMFGLYALNCVAVVRRTGFVERQAARTRAQRTGEVDWAHKTDEMALVARAVNEPRIWRADLERIPALLPANVRLTSIEFNPSGISGSGDWDRLVLSGTLHADPGQDRMRGVADMVARLQKDSVLTSHYRNIRLANTRISDPSGSSAEFAVECRP